MINYIKFKKPFLFRRFVEVKLSSGAIYKIQRRGRYVVVVPTWKEGERDTLNTVYQITWEWLNGENVKKKGYSLDMGAKVSCGRLVTLLEWPQDFTTDTQSRLNYVVEKITKAENIF